MSVLAACLSLAVFMALLKLLRVDATSMAALAAARRATAFLRNPRVDDDVKERMARRYSLLLLAHFLGISLCSAAAGAAAFVILALMDALGIVALDESFAVLTDWLFVTSVLVVSIGALGVLSVFRRRRRVGREA